MGLQIEGVVRTEAPRQCRPPTGAARECRRGKDPVGLATTWTSYGGLSKSCRHTIEVSLKNQNIYWVFPSRIQQMSLTGAVCPRTGESTLLQVLRTQDNLREDQ